MRSGSSPTVSYKSGSATCSRARSGVRRTKGAALRELHLSGRKLDKAAPRRRQGRVASGRTLPAGRLHRHQHGKAGRVGLYNNKRGTGQQWIKEGKRAIRRTRLSCRSFAANAVRLQLHALAYNLGNFLRTLVTPEPIKDWSLTSLREKLIKIGAKVVSHGRYVAFQMAESRFRELSSPTSCG
jgi:hypothetical protein